MVLWTTHLGATKTVNLRGELIQLLLNPPWGQKISKFEHYNILGSVRQRLGTIEDPHGPLADPWVLPKSTHGPSQNPLRTIGNSQGDWDNKKWSGTVWNGQDGLTSEKKSVPSCHWNLQMIVAVMNNNSNFWSLWPHCVLYRSVTSVKTVSSGTTNWPSDSFIK